MEVRYRNFSLCATISGYHMNIRSHPDPKYGVDIFFLFFQLFSPMAHDTDLVSSVERLFRSFLSIDVLIVVTDLKVLDKT